VNEQRQPLYGVNDRVYVMMDGDSIHWSDPITEPGFPPHLRGVCPLLGKIKHVGAVVDDKISYYTEFLNGRVYGWFEEQKVSPNFFELAARCGVDARVV